jgi:hypothetical protein
MKSIGEVYRGNNWVPKNKEKEKMIMLIFKQNQCNIDNFFFHYFNINIIS